MLRHCLRSKIALEFLYKDGYNRGVGEIGAIDPSALIFSYSFGPFLTVYLPSPPPSIAGSYFVILIKSTDFLKQWEILE